MEKPGFGVVLGANKGVEGFSNRKSKFFPGRNFVNNRFTGIKYQCVEFARRWLICVKGLSFQDVSCACDIWKLRSLENINTSESVPLVPIPNGSPYPPRTGALLIYKRRFLLPFGHVAIITEVNTRENYIRIAEQNEDDNYWPGDYSRQLRLNIEDNNYHIIDKYSLYGWMCYENTSEIPTQNNSRNCSIF